MSNINFKYGDYEFKPAPLFSIQSEPLKTPDGVGYGILHNISCNGHLILTGAEQLNSGIRGIFREIETLKSGLNNDGKGLQISCGPHPPVLAENVFVTGFPTIEGFSIENASDNFTLRADYTIDFRMPCLNQGTGSDTFANETGMFGSGFPPYVESATETWDVEFQDERMPFAWTITGSQQERWGYLAAVTHQVDVTARIAYTGHQYNNRPWEDAKKYASGLLKQGFDKRFLELSGVLNLATGVGGGSRYNTGVFNHFRQVSTSKSEGTISVTETFLLTPSGENYLPNNCIETFDVSTSQQDGLVSIGIQGEIVGLCTTDYGGESAGDRFKVEESKYAAATGYWNVIKGRIFGRAQTAYAGFTGTDECTYSRPLNPLIKSKTVGVNPIEGTITYDYQFDTSPSGCITGDCILSQQITIDDQLATDVFASQVVLGRAAGPILQDIGTITARVRSLNIEVVTIPPTGCSSIEEIYKPAPTGAVQHLVNTISGDLMDTYSQVFVSSNSESWNFTQGRYTKSIGFTYNNCST